jgi:hypothetical protein
MQMEVFKMSYREQFERMNRWYDRFAAINEGRVHGMSSENYVDEIYSFFQNCYHLKDWIKNDSGMTTQAPKDRVEGYITSNRFLSLSADLCNSTKHLIRNRSNRSKEEPTFGQKNFALDVGGDLPKISLKLQVDAEGGRIDAFELARECVAAWEAFLKSENLCKLGCQDYCCID